VATFAGGGAGIAISLNWTGSDRLATMLDRVDWISNMPIARTASKAQPPATTTMNRFRISIPLSIVAMIQHHIS
jgi:hypothetical protein